MTARALVLLLLSGTVAHAAAPLPSARVLTARTRVDGARATVADLDRKHQLDAVLDKIGQGSTAWVALAPRLSTGTDGAGSEGLGIELARALPRNPVAVLQAAAFGADSIIGIARVCGVPFIEATIASDNAYIRRAWRRSPRSMLRA